MGAACCLDEKSGNHAGNSDMQDRLLLPPQASTGTSISITPSSMDEKDALATAQEDEYRINNALVLLIGISKYTTEQLADLPGARRDDQESRKIWEQKYGYTVLPARGTTWYEKEEWTYEEIEQFVREQRWQLLDADKELSHDALIVSISGHGNENGILPSDYDKNDNDKKYPLPLNGLHGLVGEYGDDEFKTIPRIFIIDACRTDGQARRAQAPYDKSFLCTLYGNSPGLKVHEDADQGGHFSQCLREELRLSVDEGKTLLQIAIKVNAELKDKSERKQLCWFEGDLACGEIVLCNKSAPKIAAPNAMDAVDDQPSPSQSMQRQFLKFLQSAFVQQYAQNFRDKDCFDMRSIPDFDDDMLRDVIGIKHSGPRDRLLRKSEVMTKKMATFKKSVSEFWYNELSRYGVVTLYILCSEIKDGGDIQTKYQINDEEKCEKLFGMLEHHKEGSARRFISMKRTAVIAELLQPCGLARFAAQFGSNGWDDVSLWTTEFPGDEALLSLGMSTDDIVKFRKYCADGETERKRRAAAAAAIADLLRPYGLAHFADTFEAECLNDASLWTREYLSDATLKSIGMKAGEVSKFRKYCDDQRELAIDDLHRVSATELGNFVVNKMNNKTLDRLWRHLDEDGTGEIERDDVLNILQWMGVLYVAFRFKTQGNQGQPTINKKKLKKQFVPIKDWIVANKMQTQNVVKRDEFKELFGTWLKEYATTQSCGDEDEEPVEDRLSNGYCTARRNKVANGQVENGHRSDVEPSVSMTEDYSMTGLSDVENEGKTNHNLDADAQQKQAKAPFQIMVTSALHQHSDDEDEEPVEDTVSNKKKQKIDTTLGGVVSWERVADFSALLPRDVKLKLWNGVFKTDADLTQPEIKRLSKLLRTFAMLQLTREYKTRDETVPNEIKQQLQTAVREPAKFISGLLKKDSTFMEKVFLRIYNNIVDALHGTAAKKVKVAQQNYGEITREPLESEFNQNDFLKTAFLQYVLYAYQIKLDADANKK